MRKHKALAAFDYLCRKENEKRYSHFNLLIVPKATNRILQSNIKKCKTKYVYSIGL